jgi:clan AA aspartic protease (TIGR02281 family)
VHNTLAALLLLLVLTPYAGAQSGPTPQPLRVTRALRLFTAPDESSPQIEVPTTDDTLSPVAETIGSGGSKWYLIKTRSGIVAWIKAGASDDAKRTEEFFRSLSSRRASALAVEIPSVSSDPAPSSAILVPIQMNGSAAFVTAMLDHSVQTLMLLDTGASYTVVSRQLATSLGLNEASRAAISTANGLINVALARLGSIKVGAAEATNLTVAIHDISTNSKLGGLLGLDFLSRFHTSIDSRRQLLILAPR